MLWNLIHSVYLSVNFWNFRYTSKINSHIVQIKFPWYILYITLFHGNAKLGSNIYFIYKCRQPFTIFTCYLSISSLITDKDTKFNITSGFEIDICRPTTRNRCYLFCLFFRLLSVENRDIFYVILLQYFWCREYFLLQY